LLEGGNNYLWELEMRRISPVKLEIVRRGMVQADIASAAHMSETRLSRLLNGRARPRDYEVKNLAHALGLKREELSI